MSTCQSKSTKEKRYSELRNQCPETNYKSSQLRARRAQFGCGLERQTLATGTPIALFTVQFEKLRISPPCYEAERSLQVVFACSLDRADRIQVFNAYVTSFMGILGENAHKQL
jgi:hypothetical protein